MRAAFSFLTLAFVLSGAAAWPAAANQARPSFDCSKAQAADEKAICADPELARIDRLVAESYTAFAAANPQSARRLGRELLADRHDCAGERACIASAQIDALTTYGGGAQWAVSYRDALVGIEAEDLASHARPGLEQPMPTRLGNCAMSTISSLGTRLGDQPFANAGPDDGTTLALANGTAGVSYEREAALVSAGIGDPVVSCLVSIPRDCPAGDDRGRQYLTIDLRTKTQVTLPDSQHMCGGA